MDETRIGLILLLLREGSTRNAIKTYEEEAGVSYLAAKRSVGDLARKHHIHNRRFSTASLLLITLVGVLGLILTR